MGARGHPGDLYPEHHHGRNHRADFAPFRQPAPLPLNHSSKHIMSHSPASAYLLIFRDKTPDVYRGLSADQRPALMDRWNAWYEGLAAAGTVQHGHALQPAGRGVSGSRGERVT